MWDLIVSVPDHCLSFYFIIIMSPSFRVGMHIVFARVVCLSVRLSVCYKIVSIL